MAPTHFERQENVSSVFSIPHEVCEKIRVETPNGLLHGNEKETERVLRAIRPLNGTAPVALEHSCHDPCCEVIHESGAQPSTLTLREWLDVAEASRIRQILRECRGNRSAAARKLGIGRRTLYSKMERLQIAQHVARNKDPSPV